MKTGTSTPGLTNTKEGRVPSTDGAPGLPAKGDKVFAESPESTRADADDPQETANLRAENATAPRG